MLFLLFIGYLIGCPFCLLFLIKLIFIKGKKIYNDRLVIRSSDPDLVLPLSKERRKSDFLSHYEVLLCLSRLIFLCPFFLSLMYLCIDLSSLFLSVSLCLLVCPPVSSSLPVSLSLSQSLLLSTSICL